MKDENELIGSAEAAKLLGIERTTLYQWTSKKLVPFVRVSRNLIKFNREELQSWIAARRIEAIGDSAGQRPGSKTEGKGPADEAHGKTATKAATEKPKDRALSKERRAKKIKRYALDAREQERRRQRARQKAIEDAAGRPDVYE
ncbi:MAG: helix-turn-helix domain-containing protein [Spirochaetia bacterium]|jgi:excisionase family DNA binding protein